MKYLSLFSGIEAASVAWHPLGWEPVAFAEIEPFACAVLAHHYPDVPNLGNVEEFGDAEIRRCSGADLIIFGSPCQSFSVAGKRLGLDDPRGNLALHALRLVEKIRPRWLVFENVPGLLSSGNGRDFGTFLWTLGQCGYHCAYRVLDAQYVRVDGFGRAVPQRRRRVFVVGHLGDWRRAAAVLFVGEGLPGDTAPRREAGKGIAPSLAARTKGGGGLGTDFDCDGGLVAYGGNRMSGPVEVATAVNAHGGPHGRLDLESETFCVRTPQTGANGIGVSEGAAHTLDGTGGEAVASFNNQAAAARSLGYSPGVSVTLKSANNPSLHQGMTVRRLTPRECERLQGFLDDYTLIPYRGKPASDGPRYKALGNSMAINCIRWLGRRIEMVEEVSPSPLPGP